MENAVFEWTINLSGILTSLVVVVGFIFTAFLNSIAVGRYFGGVDKRLEAFDKRMETLEKAEEHITEVLVEMARSKVELQMMSKRIDDVQHYGSHKLAEILSTLRDTISTDYRKQIDDLHDELNRRIAELRSNSQR